MKQISPLNRIVVFGSNGMVGSAIVRKLKEKKYCKIMTPTKKDLNLLNFNEVQKWFEKFKPEVVILAAAKVGGIFANSEYPADFILENLKIQTNVIENSYNHNIQKLLFLGSSCIYPKYANQPIKEEELLNGYLEPSNQWYAIAKIAGMKICEAFNNQYGFNAITLMPTNLYGPGDNYHSKNSHVLPGLIKRFYDAKINNKKKVVCWGTGNPQREFLHVDDLAEACLFTLQNWDLKNDLAPKDENGKPIPYLNVGTGKDLSIYEIAYLISEIIGYKGAICWDHSKPDGTPKKLLDCSRINKLGWYPKIKLEDGLKTTIDLYKESFIVNKISS